MRNPLKTITVTIMFVGAVLWLVRSVLILVADWPLPRFSQFVATALAGIFMLFMATDINDRR